MTPPRGKLGPTTLSPRKARNFRVSGKVGSKGALQNASFRARGRKTTILGPTHGRWRQLPRRTLKGPTRNLFPLLISRPKHCSFSAKRAKTCILQGPPGTKIYGPSKIAGLPRRERRWTRLSARWSQLSHRTRACRGASGVGRAAVRRRRRTGRRRSAATSASASAVRSLGLGRARVERHALWNGRQAVRVRCES